MSANVFKTFGPIGQMMPVGGAALCGTEYYPVGFSASDLMELYWMTRTVDAQCPVTVSAGAESAHFPGGIVDGPVLAGGNRHNLITNGTWTVSVPSFTTGGIVGCNFDLFIPSTSPNVYSLVSDGLDWYPAIRIVGEASANDGGGASAVVQWDSFVTTNPLGTPGVAKLLGKNIPLSYLISTSGGGSAFFGSPELIHETDWPYT